MLQVMNRSLKRLAYLQNAIDQLEEEKLSGVGRLTFSLPADDPKSTKLTPYTFIKTNANTVYRLTGEGTLHTASTLRTYEAEHAVATLADDLMFGSVILGGTGVPLWKVIEAILSRQTTKHWVLGACDFAHQYEYGFESANLLSALYSLTDRLADDFQWTYDMRAYPWKLSLRRLNASARPTFHIRAGRNLLAGRQAQDAAQITTRLYLLGAGEGNHQLTINAVNSGLPYLDSPKAYQSRYGIVSRLYVDRTIEDAQALKARGQAVLKLLQEPSWQRTFEVAELYPLTGREIDRARAGDLVCLQADGTRAFVTEVRRRLDAPGVATLSLSTSPLDIAGSIADLAARVQGEQTHSQGATQIFAQSVQANATPGVAAVINFIIPQEMRIIHRVMVRVTMEPFRSYSRTTAGGGQVAQTSAAGGGQVTTSGYGGGSTQTTSSGGETTMSAAQTVTLDGGVGFTTDASSVTVTGEPHVLYSQVTGGANGQTGSASAVMTGSSSAGRTGGASGTVGSASPAVTNSANGAIGTHSHVMLHTHTLNMHVHETGAHQHTMLHTHGLNMHTHPIGSHRHHMSHTHSVWHQHRIPGHTHTMKAHTHTVSVPGHAHSVSIAGHAHGVVIPEHRHAIEQGIFLFGNPRSARVHINGAERLAMGRELDADLTPYLVGADGKIPRGSWIRLGVLPDDLAYVTIDVVVQGFIQSRGGGSH